MSISRVLIAALLLLSMLVLPGSGWGSSPVRVVVSIEPQRWLVEQIGGGQVEVQVLVEPGESPTSYQPTDAQVTQLLRSDLFMRIGVPFERGLWFEAVAKLGRIRMVDLRDGIELRAEDPHIWLSPRLLTIQASTVSEALSQVDPLHRADYQARLDGLESRLAELDGKIREQLEPFSGRAFFVFHPSWGYFADEYGLLQKPVEVGGREPSDRELTELQKQARQSGITTVFVQPQIQGRAAQAFAATIGAQIVILDPLAGDVAANLVATAHKLAQAFGEEASHGE